MELEEALKLLTSLERARPSFDAVNQAVRIALAQARASRHGVVRNDLLRAAARGLERVHKHISSRNASLPDPEGLASETKARLLEQFLKSANPPTVEKECSFTLAQARARTLAITRNLRVSDFRSAGRRTKVFSPTLVDPSLLRAPARWQPENMYEERQRRAIILGRLKAVLRKYPTCLDGQMPTARLLRHMQAGTPDKLILLEVPGVDPVNLRQAKSRLRQRLQRMAINLPDRGDHDDIDPLRGDAYDDGDPDFGGDDDSPDAPLVA
jgi:hypothetical protein